VGLYLCVFASASFDEEIDGVEVGGYDDFHAFRSTVAERLEGGRWGARFPILMSHADSDGEWSSSDAAGLRDELRTIAELLDAVAPVDLEDGSWQADVARSAGVRPRALSECFIDVDGESLLDRLQELAHTAADRNCPISFQ
jgi:hypothetical protein